MRVAAAGAGSRPAPPTASGRRRPAAGRQAPVAISQASSEAIAVASPAGVALGEREDLEVGEQVERVVGAGAVGAEADRDPRLARRRVGEDAADRELHVGDRVGDHGAAALGDQLELGAVEPDAVGEHRALAEQPEPVEVVGGAHAVGGEAVLDLLLGLGEVDVDRQTALGGEFGGPAQQLLAGDVDRVRGQRRLDPERARTPPARSRLASAVASISAVSSPRPKSGPPTVARRPASRTAREVASGCQYMSQKRAVPVRIISTQASRVPQ